VQRVLARIAPLGWHVVLHWMPRILTYREFLERLRMPFVIDHMGRVEAMHGLQQKPFRCCSIC